MVILLTSKIINKAERDKKELAKTYNVDLSCIIWIGNNKYIVILKNGQEIRI